MQNSWTWWRAILCFDSCKTYNIRNLPAGGGGHIHQRGELPDGLKVTSTAKIETSFEIRVNHGATLGFESFDADSDLEICRNKAQTSVLGLCIEDYEWIDGS
jgi:hypothetical protein